MTPPCRSIQATHVHDFGTGASAPTFLVSGAIHSDSCTITDQASVLHYSATGAQNWPMPAHCSSLLCPPVYLPDSRTLALPCYSADQPVIHCVQYSPAFTPLATVSHPLPAVPHTLHYFPGTKSWLLVPKGSNSSSITVYLLSDTFQVINTCSIVSSLVLYVSVAPDSITVVHWNPSHTIGFTIIKYASGLSILKQGQFPSPYSSYSDIGSKPTRLSLSPDGTTLFLLTDTDIYSIRLSDELPAPRIISLPSTDILFGILALNFDQVALFYQPLTRKNDHVLAISVYEARFGTKISSHDLDLSTSSPISLSCLILHQERILAVCNRSLYSFSLDSKGPFLLSDRINSLMSSKNVSSPNKEIEDQMSCPIILNHRTAQLLANGKTQKARSISDTSVTSKNQRYMTERQIATILKECLDDETRIGELLSMDISPDRMTKALVTAIKSHEHVTLLGRYLLKCLNRCEDREESAVPYDHLLRWICVWLDAFFVSEHIMSGQRAEMHGIFCEIYEAIKTRHLPAMDVMQGLGEILEMHSKEARPKRKGIEEMRGFKRQVLVFKSL